MSELKDISSCLRHIADNFEQLDEIMYYYKAQIETLENEVSKNEDFKKKLRDLLNEEVAS